MSSSIAKLGRAKEHRDTLGNEIQRFLQSEPYTVSVHVDFDASRFEARAHEKHRPDTVRWGLIFGEALYNIRCALDYLAYALTILDTGEDPPLEAGEIQFPLVTEAKKWGSTMESRIPRVGTTVQAAIETLQPYHRHDDETIKNRIGDHPLELLATLNNADKHRLLPVIAVWKAQVAYHSTMPNGGSPYVDVEPDHARSFQLTTRLDHALKENAVIGIGVFNINGPNPAVHVGAKVSPAMVVEYERRDRSRSLDFPVTGLDRIITFVEGEVFGRIARALGA